MGISQKIKTALNLLKDIAREYAVLTRKNKCIPSTRKAGSRKPPKKRGVSNAKNRTSKNSKKVNFVVPEEPVEPIKSEEPEEPMKPEEPVKIEEPEEQRNPFETSVEPEEPEEEVGEPNPIDDGFTNPKP